MRPFTGTVAVTGLNATDNPGPGVAVIRSLRQDPRFQGRIVGLAYETLDPGLYYPGLLDAAFLIPYPSTGREALFSRLAYIKETAGLDVLLPTLDSELPALLGQEDRLAALGIATFLPSRAQFDARAKANLDGLRESFGIPVPKSETLTELDALYTLHERFSYPLVVKGVFYGAKVAWSADQAVAAFHYAAAKWGLPVIVQEFVSGEEVNVCALGDGQGGLVGAVAMKKMMITDSGKGWAGVTIADEGLMQLTRAFMAATKWRGACEVEVIRDGQGGYHLLEVNPRFPAWCDLTAGAGQNQPLAYVELAQGKAPRPLPDYEVGTAFVRISLDQILHISELEAITAFGEVFAQNLRRSA